MKLLPLSTLLLITILSYGQSKNQQIEFLTFRVDSLNNELSTTRDKAFKDIQSRDATIDGLKTELTQLKSDLSDLESFTTLLTTDNQILKLDMEEMSMKNLELEAKLITIEDEIKNKVDDLKLNLITFNEEESPAGIIDMTVADYVIQLLDGSTVIDTFRSEYAEAVYFEPEEGVVYTRSEAGSQSTYYFRKIGTHEVTVIKTWYHPDFSEDGHDEDIWIKTYKRNINNNWELFNCKGECK